ncbi:hypothetical protein Y5S_01035 [Alcanivorax nanhaiticus]|uniref:Uncharacterized protein n=1 Tax=Alcanivorax nanhaiticus TaxID=1177154 RepID=A0A095SMC2_9GAMM|nr:hypothetical protein Y5S_01035 [Alcanivorax nanhaiticus]
MRTCFKKNPYIFVFNRLYGRIADFPIKNPGADLLTHNGVENAKHMGSLTGRQLPAVTLVLLFWCEK